ncbi:zinc finger protein 497 isoform X7 [Toxorhynchites rutilus septentrionalis]|uniref:zinc finger protein 497 isoform X7 n=1 Tax=Toxorhynchites rutilus septentrionalis TaxID=329112 RepID=UPI00247A7761|nr:zinc finger protein 497 isoform X7 [Toxorhynchites rutilus septentrionalis]
MTECWNHSNKPSIGKIRPTMKYTDKSTETGANKCAYMDIDAIYFQLLLLLKQGITKGMMPNFYDHSRPTMVPTSSAAMLGASTNSGEQSQKKTQIAPFDLEATLQAVDNEVLEGEEGSCPLCNKTFSRKSSLLNHIRNHTAEKKYICEYCQKGFSQQANLRNHVRIHTNERPYVCVDCGKAFTQITNLNNHRRLHTGERPYVCIEANCGRSFAQVTNLNNHMKTHHKTQQFLTCPVLGCNEGFTMKNQLTKHMQMRHPAIDLKKGPLSAGTAVRPPKHCCHYFNCNESFDSSEGLSNHLRVTHGLPIAAPEDKKPMPQQMIGNGGGDIHMTQIHTPPPLLGASFQSYQQQITEAQQHAGSTAEKQKAYSVSDLLNISEEMQQHHHQQQQQRVGQQNGKPDLEQILEDRVNNLSRIKTELQANMQIQNLFGLSSPMGLNPFASPTKLVCSFCYNVYKTPQTLSRHIEKFHS